MDMETTAFSVDGSISWRGMTTHIFKRGDSIDIGGKEYRVVTSTIVGQLQKVLVSSRPISK